jgi:hypothetical protein
MTKQSDFFRRPVVAREVWTSGRLERLLKGKEFVRLRDEENAPQATEVGEDRSEPYV